jgi:hypothetical protein
MPNFPIAAASLATLMRHFGLASPVAGLTLQTVVRTQSPQALWLNTNVSIDSVSGRLFSAGFGGVVPYVAEITIRLRGYQYVRLGPRFTPVRPLIQDGTSNTILVGETINNDPPAPLRPGTFSGFANAATQPILSVMIP